MKVAFIGLGVMGFPMAGHLAKNNHQVTIYNRTAAKAQEWLSKYTGEIASSPALAAKNADVIFTCVSRDEDVMEVLNGQQGVLYGIADNKIIVDHSTTSTILVEQVQKLCAAKNISFLDAPVSGGQQGAINGSLTVMLGGPIAAFNSIKPLLECYAKNITYLGAAGNGQLTKMANQICIAGILQGLSEAINFAKNANLDIELVIKALQAGAAQSWQLENRALTMSQDKFDFGFAVDLMRKDLNIVLNEAEKNKSSIPLTAQICQFYKQLHNAGDGRLDTSSLIKLLSN